MTGHGANPQYVVLGLVPRSHRAASSAEWFLTQRETEQVQQLSALLTASSRMDIRSIDAAVVRLIEVVGVDEVASDRRTGASRIL